MVRRGKPGCGGNFIPGNPPEKEPFPEQKSVAGGGTYQRGGNLFQRLLFSIKRLIKIRTSTILKSRKKQRGKSVQQSLTKRRKRG